MIYVLRLTLALAVGLGWLTYPWQHIPPTGARMVTYITPRLLAATYPGCPLVSHRMLCISTAYRILETRYDYDPST